jgi:S1-C subfamily serine protease
MFSKLIFRWFFLALSMSTTLYSGCAGLDNKTSKKLIASQERVRLYPKECLGYIGLGNAYSELNQFQKAIVPYREAIRLNLCSNKDYIYLYIGDSHNELGQLKLAIEAYKEAIRNNPNYAKAHFKLGQMYKKLPNSEEAIITFKRAIDIEPNNPEAHLALGNIYQGLNRYEEAIVSYLEVYRLDSKYNWIQSVINNLKQKSGQTKPLPPIKEQPQSPKHKKEPPSLQVGSGSGFFVSKKGLVITNAHVVKDCNKITVGDKLNKQVPTELVNTDRRNDLALLKVPTLEMVSDASKSLIQKLGVVVVPLADKGLLRSDDVRQGEEVLVAGYPLSDVLSNKMIVTFGNVSATRGMNDDSGGFQLDAAVQYGNSGGPIYDMSGNIVGVVVSRLNKQMFNSENVNFGIKASTVRQFLVANGIPSKKSGQKENKSGEQISEIARNQTVMVMCYK